MHALATRQPHEALQPGFLQPIAHITCTALHLGPAHALTRIKIEHQPVGMFGIGHCRSPGMQFQGVHLHQLQQAAFVIDIDVVLAPAFLLQRHCMHGVAQALAVVFLEEARLAHAIGTAQQRQRSSTDFRQDPARHLPVVVGNVALAELLLRKHHALGMGDGNVVAVVGRCCTHRQILLLLVTAQSLETGLAQQSFLAPAAERDFGHRHRLHPAHAGRTERHVRRQLQHRGLHRQRRQRGRQRAQALVVEAGTDPADVAQAALVRRGQQQRTKSHPRALWCGVADDQEFIGVLMLHLHPAARAGVHVGRVHLLADDAFEARLAAGFEHRRAVVDDVLAESQRANCITDQFFQQCFAFQQRRAADVDAGHARQIEHDVAQRLFRAAVDHPLQRGEVAAAVVVQHYQFPIQARIAHRQRLHRLHHFGKIRRPIQAIARA
ncbi:hypothetical protein SRABI35_02075 [Stenotrophomonas lactitubi]|nr:hypothetical protein SRABI35_02075 [Stenotrophomonas lactitubi]